MNDVLRWKKADELEKLIKDQKAQVEASERELSELRRTVTNWASIGLPGTTAFSVVGHATAFSVVDHLTVKKLRATELWLNDYIYLDATGFHSIVEEEK